MATDIVLNEMKPSCSKSSMTKKSTSKNDEETAFDMTTTTTTMISRPRPTPLSVKAEIQLTEVVCALVSGHQTDEPEVKEISATKRRLLALLEQVRSRHTWTVIMVSLGTLYMLTNLWNIMQLWDKNLTYELVVGPPMFIMKILIAVFTGVGTIVWIFELANTLSVYYHGGYTFVSLTIEMLFTISAVHIPIAALNYFTAQCRANHTSAPQIFSGAFSIAYVFTRMIWFAHLQGTKLKLNEKREMKQGLFMLMCALFSCAMAFQIMSWRGSSPTELTEHTNNVSIVFLRLPFKHNEQIVHNMTASRLEQHGLLPFTPYILPNMTHIVHRGDKGLIAYFVCNHDNDDDYDYYDDNPSNNGTTETKKLPYLCDKTINGLQVKVIKFHVKFEHGNNMLPYGEIQYNYALMTSLHVSLANHDVTVATTRWSTDEPVELLKTVVDLINKQQSVTLQTLTQYQEIMTQTNGTNMAAETTMLVNALRNVYTRQSIADKQQEIKLKMLKAQDDRISNSTVRKPADIQLKEFTDPQQYVSGIGFHGNVTESSDCFEVKKKLGDNWGVWLLVATVNAKGNVTFESPWISSCTTPYTRFNPRITVC